LKILIAEDNLAGRELLCEMLELWGHVVIECSNGEEAVAQLEQHRVDLVLLDIQMPVLDGLATIRRIQDSRQPNLKVVALTAFAMAGDKERFLQAGFADYQAKPLDFAQLRLLIDRFSAAMANPSADLPRGPATHPH